jgi:hypothetical protein
MLLDALEEALEVLDLVVGTVDVVPGEVQHPRINVVDLVECLDQLRSVGVLAGGLVEEALRAPAAVSAACWRARFCSRVETRPYPTSTPVWTKAAGRSTGGLADGVSDMAFRVPGKPVSALLDSPSSRTRFPDALVGLSGRFWILSGNRSLDGQTEGQPLSRPPLARLSRAIVLKPRSVSRAVGRADRPVRRSVDGGQRCQTRT